MNNVEEFIEQGMNMTTIPELPNYISYQDLVIGTTIQISIIVLIVLIIGYFILKRIRRNKIKKEEK